MTRPLRFALVATLLLAGVPTASPQRRRPAPEPTPTPEPPADIRVRASLSQTAAWVGDTLEYVIELETAPGVDVVAEDLAPEKLVLEGLELGTASETAEMRSDGWRVSRHHYRITAWDTTPPKRIGALTIRFRRPVTTAAADGSAPSAELIVPPALLTVRSTLPDDGSAAGARDGRAATAAPAWLGWLRPVGFGFIVLGIAPVVLWLASFARRPRMARPRPSSRSLHAHLKALFDELAIVDTSTTDGRRRAYDRLDADLRAYVAEAEGVPAQALTADELRARLGEARRVPVGPICDVLAECERARYAPADRLPGAEALGSTIATLRTALGR